MVTVIGYSEWLQCVVTVSGYSARLGRPKKLKNGERRLHIQRVYRVLGGSKSVDRDGREGRVNFSRKRAASRVMECTIEPLHVSIVNIHRRRCLVCSKFLYTM